MKKLFFYFLLSISLTAIVAFFFGASLILVLSEKRRLFSLKKIIKIESRLYFEHINKQLDFLIKEGEKVQKEKKILKNSPFFAFVRFNPTDTVDTLLNTKEISSINKPFYGSKANDPNDPIKSEAVVYIYKEHLNKNNFAQLKLQYENTKSDTKYTNILSNQNDKTQDIEDLKQKHVFIDLAKKVKFKSLHQTQSLIFPSSQKNAIQKEIKDSSKVFFPFRPSVKKNDDLEKKYIYTDNFALKKIIIKQQRPFFVFIKTFNDTDQWVAFLKKEKENFLLFPPSFGNKKSSLVFVTNKNGDIFFHTRKSRLFTSISKNSPEKKFIKKYSKNTYLDKNESYAEKKDRNQHAKESFNFKSSALQKVKFFKKKGIGYVYYFQKWNKGNLYLVSKTSYPLPLLAKTNVFIFILFLSFLLLIVWIKFSFLFFHLSAAYQFLKKAVLSFDKVKFFPVKDIPKNPLLYFYSNRLMFLNQKPGENKKNQTSHLKENLSFKDVIYQELEKLKSKFPNLVVKQNLILDVKLFGFEKFLRPIIYELLLNAIESMGGLNEPKISISLTQQDQKDCLFVVRDYGQGVQEKDYKKCFQMYYSTKSKTGLGLNLAYSIAKANGGNVWMSQPKRDSGLKLCLRLPLKTFLVNHHLTSKCV